MDSASRNYPEGLDARAPRAQDYWRVNLAEPWEITFWTREFGCSEAQLKGAVQAAGKSAGAVRARLLDQGVQQHN